MAMKDELIIWNKGCMAFENKEYDRAIDIFETIADSSRIHFNMSTAFRNLRLIEDAIASLTRAIACDVYMAVSYFQRGVCFYLKGMLPESLADFTDALAFLRGNLLIDYTQLGLSFKLFACEVSFNRGLCFAALNQVGAALADFDDAMRTRPLDGSKDYRIFEGRFGMSIEYGKGGLLGKSKVVAAVDENDNFAGFSGSRIKAETLHRKTTKGPLDHDNNFPASAALPRGTSLRRSDGTNAATAPMGHDGIPVTYATLSRRPTQTTSPSDLPRRTTQTTSPSDLPRRTTQTTSPSDLPRRATQTTTPDPIPMTRTLTGGRYDSDDASRGMRRRPSEPAVPVGRYGDEIRYDGGSERGYMEREDVVSTRDEYGDGRGKTAMLQRRNTTMSTTSSTMSSGDKFKIKCHYTDTRILLVPVNVTFDDLSARVQKKFSAARPLKLKYKDVDDELVLMTDQEDLEVAFEMSGLEYGVVGGGGTDRFEIWCFAT
ncbi:hypothetical protein BC829DRAFT_436973 [Chytridium lagenaria]|nr:hypothetical protein BC829DRAFT_436973 [Chytridium lagenaria]